MSGKAGLISFVGKKQGGDLPPQCYDSKTKPKEEPSNMQVENNSQKCNKKGKGILVGDGHSLYKTTIPTRLTR